MGQTQSVDLTATLLLGAALVSAALIVQNLRIANRGSKIPTVGVGSGLFAVHHAGQNSVTKLSDWITEGYSKYRARVFKIRSSQKWNYIVSGNTLISELQKAPDDVLSFIHGASEFLQSDYTMGKNHSIETVLPTALVKTRLTRSLAGLFPEVTDEINAAFTDEITNKLHGDEWTSMYAVGPIMNVVCRTSNRIFIGQPLCRNPDYVRLNVQYTIDLVQAANKIRRYPSFLKPLVGNYLTPLPRTMTLARRVMTEELKRRKSLTEQHGKGKHWEGKPNDFLQWVLDTGEEKDTSIEVLLMTILRLNFAAIHTTALSFTFALYHVAAEPEKYQEPIRQEVHETLSRYGWTKTAMEKLRRVDSLLRESQRYHGLGSLSMTRKALQDFEFSDGTKIPKGEIVAVASRPVHFDGSFYPRADEFDGWRFYQDLETDSTSHNSVTDIEEKEKGLSLENQLVNTNLEFLSFGIGRHACPGRFWAANEMKAMLAYMVMNYEFKMENDGVVPPEMWHGSAVSPDPTAKILIRKREAPVF